MAYDKKKDDFLNDNSVFFCVNKYFQGSYKNQGKHQCSSKIYTRYIPKAI